MACCSIKSKERQFRPNYTFKSLSEKFYARHENIDIMGRDLTRIPYFKEKIEERLRFDCRSHYYAPITQNQTYGWLERSADKYTGLDAEILMHKAPFDETLNVLKKIVLDVYKFKKLG